MRGVDRQPAAERPRRAPLEEPPGRPHILKPWRLPFILQGTRLLAAAGNDKLTVRGFFGVFRYSRRALELVWSTNSALTVALALLTLLAAFCRPASPTSAR